MLQNYLLIRYIRKRFVHFLSCRRSGSFHLLRKIRTDSHTMPRTTSAQFYTYSFLIQGLLTGPARHWRGELAGKLRRGFCPVKLFYSVEEDSHYCVPLGCQAHTTMRSSTTTSVLPRGSDLRFRDTGSFYGPSREFWDR